MICNIIKSGEEVNNLTKLRVLCAILGVFAAIALFLLNKYTNSLWRLKEKQNKEILENKIESKKRAQIENNPTFDDIQQRIQNDQNNIFTLDNTNLIKVN